MAPGPTGAGAFAPPPRRRGGDEPIALLYENESWNLELARALRREGLDIRCIDLRHAGFSLDEAHPRALYFNRLSPSAAARGHGAALDLGRALLRKLEAEGRAVVNGAEAFEHELSKLRQYVALKRLGLPVPRTVALLPGASLPRGAFEIAYPAILKPNTGGSGVGLSIVASPSHAAEVIRSADSPAESWLLQEKITNPKGEVLRLEFIGGRLVYAMRVHAVNTFNLCPAEACDRPPARTVGAPPPSVSFAWEPAPDRGLIVAARSILATVGLEVGGVEVIEDANGRPVFIDLNATSVWRRDVAAAAGVDPYRLLAGYLKRQRTGALGSLHVA